MKTNILKKLFVKIIKSLGYEIIDQNQFNSPTLNKELNQNLSDLNKSIILPLGEVKITRKITSLLIIFRTNSNVEIWDQNKKRIFEKSKFNFVTLITNEKIVKFLEEESEFAETLRTEIDEKSEILFEKSIDSQIKLKKLIDKDNKIYNDADKKSLEYLIENSE